jgi:hypothetical protein
MAEKDYKDLVLDYKPIDSAELHKEIAAELGDKFLGVSTGMIDGEDKIIIHLTPDARGTENSKALLAYAAHDVSKLPPKPVRKTIEERLEEMANEIALLKADKQALEAQSVKK